MLLLAPPLSSLCIIGTAGPSPKDECPPGLTVLGGKMELDGHEEASFRALFVRQEGSERAVTMP